MEGPKRLHHLLSLYARNECSREEYEELLSIVADQQSTEEAMEGLKVVIDSADNSPRHTKAEWDLLYASVMHKTIRKQSGFSTFSKFAVTAAAVLILSVLTFYLYQGQRWPDVHKTVHTVNQDPLLAPGGNQAILTLADGKKIVLNNENNGPIANQSGVSIAKTAEGQIEYKILQVKSSPGEQPQFNTIETPRGGQYKINLPDGSRVWLNAMSSLRYPVNFGGKFRQVELSGEGYFEVSPNKQMPFKVLTTGQTVEVLGTQFNINAYANERHVRTTLVEGAVKVLSEQHTAVTKLQPGEQALLSSGELAVRKVDTELAVAWKNGYFIFNDTNLESILREMSRWYDIDIVYKNQAVRKRLFSGTISRFENASQVLDILQLTGIVHFKIEGRSVTVM